MYIFPFLSTNKYETHGYISPGAVFSEGPSCWQNSKHF